MNDCLFHMKKDRIRRVGYQSDVCMCVCAYVCIGKVLMDDIDYITG